DYLNVKADYVKAIWNIANWSNVQERFTVAREKTAGLLVLS
ncbi:MAG: superoxide dismutase, partial [Microbacterium sp.]|nr:superoxide dismutase [Microbacterium sp.]